jgi:hypothetical protein
MTWDYEVASEGAVRHWEIPYARLEDVTPTVREPAAVVSLLPGTQLTGTILTVDATAAIAVIDFTTGMVYRHSVRNVLTYNPGVAELTWGPINIGDPVYYDGSATMVALGIQLSTSPLDLAGVANPLFGFVVPAPLDANWDTDSALFPLGAALVASTHRIAVMQIVAGH